MTLRCSSTKEIRKIVESITKLSGYVNWTTDIKKEVWSALSVLPDDEIIDNDKFCHNKCSTSENIIDRFVDTNKDVMSRSFEDTSLTLREVEKVLKQYHCKKENVNLIKRLNRRIGSRTSELSSSMNSHIQNIHGSDKLPVNLMAENHDSIDHEQAIRNFTLETSLLDTCSKDQYDTDSRTFDDKGFSFEDFDCAQDVKSYSLEDYVAEAFLESNTNPDEYSKYGDEQSTSKEKINERYNFENWLTDAQILSESDLQKEEEKEYWINTRSHIQTGANKVEGATIGLHDVYDDSYGQMYEKYQSGMPKGSTDNTVQKYGKEWFGTYFHRTNEKKSPISRKKSSEYLRKLPGDDGYDELLGGWQDLGNQTDFYGYVCTHCWHTR